MATTTTTTAQIDARANYGRGGATGDEPMPIKSDSVPLADRVSSRPFRRPRHAGPPLPVNAASADGGSTSADAAAKHPRDGKGYYYDDEEDDDDDEEIVPEPTGRQETEQEAIARTRLLQRREKLMRMGYDETAIELFRLGEARRIKWLNPEFQIQRLSDKSVSNAIELATVTDEEFDERVVVCKTPTYDFVLEVCRAIDLSFTEEMVPAGDPEEMVYYLSKDLYEAVAEVVRRLRMLRPDISSAITLDTLAASVKAPENDDLRMIVKSLAVYGWYYWKAMKSDKTTRTAKKFENICAMIRDISVVIANRLELFTSDAGVSWLYLARA
jgi:hypothetical protein